MAEMAQQTPLVIEVADMTALTNAEKEAVRRAAVRKNELNIVLIDGSGKKSKVIASDIEEGQIGSNVSIAYFDNDGGEMLQIDCGAITADDFSDDTPANE